MQFLIKKNFLCNEKVFLIPAVIINSPEGLIFIKLPGAKFVSTLLYIHPQC